MRLVKGAEARNANVLGKAVHPDALHRLHELFPDARVTVRQIATPLELPHGTQRMGNRYYAKPEHETHVVIELLGLGRNRVVEGFAICHPLDNYDRRRGIALAFTRALDEARRVHDPHKWAEARRANRKKYAK